MPAPRLPYHSAGGTSTMHRSKRHMPGGSGSGSGSGSVIIFILSVTVSVNTVSVSVSVILKKLENKNSRNHVFNLILTVE